MTQKYKYLIVLISLFLIGCSMSTYKVLKESGKVRVLDRPTNKECSLLWSTTNEKYSEDVYGPPCNVIIRKYHE